MGKDTGVFLRGGGLAWGFHCGAIDAAWKAAAQNGALPAGEAERYL
jgi:hypothetical protein